MAELDIGEQCMVADCKQLDFLPCHCDLCGLVYCKEHASYIAHSCSQYDHASVRTEGIPVDSQPILFSCSLSSCSNRELVEIRCEHCSNNFCLAHRHCVDHSCPNTPDTSAHQLPKTSEHVRQLLQKQQDEKKTTARPKVSQKSAAMAAKISLMKLKQKAVGDSSIPEVERIFFNVVLPLGSRQKSVTIFVNRCWSIGKAIDKIATCADLTNANNVAGARQLCLFEAASGKLLMVDQILSDLIDAAGKVDEIYLYNGSTVILEYVDTGVTSLDNLEPYSV